MTHIRGSVPPALVRGFSLVELMISLLLGLLVVGAAGSVFIANKRVYAASETLNRVQENSRVSFEMMSRDVREAAGSPCGNSSKVVNIVQGSSTNWWSMFGDGLRGYDGGSAAGSGSAPVAGAVVGTDALDLFGGSTTGGDYVITDSRTPSAELGIRSATDPTLGGLADGDIAIACNTKFTIVFQITAVSGSSLKVQHNGGNGSPGNCGQDFQYDTPTNCNGASGGNTYCFTTPTSSCDKFDNIPAVLTKLGGIRWYVGSNGRGSRSLYRAMFDSKATGAVPTILSTEEVAEGVSDLQLQYRSVGSTAFVGAPAVANWKAVNAVQLRVVTEGVAGAITGQGLKGTDNKALSREFTHVVALRNREGVL